MISEEETSAGYSAPGKVFESNDPQGTSHDTSPDEESDAGPTSARCTCMSRCLTACLKKVSDSKMDHLIHEWNETKL